ncbi:hypothetical protein GDO86_003360 [Hymenochirus boettgeri]|uniref:Uncharacterized protein n=1 Tax=Hymenochirus boettgeri TaxID=247094 RepID=A0A8T2K960_9PIPI|nr:hypothetical protein GDO86_003360 [Hymenochirus boettgeri]
MHGGREYLQRLRYSFNLARKIEQRVTDSFFGVFKLYCTLYTLHVVREHIHSSVLGLNALPTADLVGSTHLDAANQITMFSI